VVAIPEDHAGLFAPSDIRNLHVRRCRIFSSRVSYFLGVDPTVLTSRTDVRRECHRVLLNVWRPDRCVGPCPGWRRDTSRPLGASLCLGCVTDRSVRIRSARQWYVVAAIVFCTDSWSSGQTNIPAFGVDLSLVRAPPSGLAMACGRMGHRRPFHRWYLLARPYELEALFQVADVPTLLAASPSICPSRISNIRKPG